MSAMDTARGRILIAGGLGGDHHLYTISTNSFTTVSFNGANAANIGGTGAAMVYIDVIDRYLVRKGGAGGTVNQIDPTTFEVTAYPATGGGSIPPPRTVPTTSSFTFRGWAA